MFNEEIYVIAEITAKEQEQRIVKAILVGLIAPTRIEEGCLEYNLTQPQNNPNKFVFLERWTSQDAFNQHQAATYVIEAKQKLNGLLFTEPIITLCNPIA